MSDQSSRKFGDWLQTTANIAIIGGLVLVGFQMKQNADLMRIQLVYDESERLVATERAILGENSAAIIVKSVTRPRELTFEERRIVEAYIYTLVEQWRAMASLAAEGLVLDSDWKMRVGAEAAYVLGNPYGRAWWTNFKQDNDTLPSELIELVDLELANDPNNTMDYHNRIVRETEKILSAPDPE